MTSTNGAEIAKQWIDVHGASTEPSVKDKVSGFPHRVWMLGGEAVVEAYSITGMAHGTPIDPNAAYPRCRYLAVRDHRSFLGASDQPGGRGRSGSAATAPGGQSRAPPPKRFDVGAVNRQGAQRSRADGIEVTV
jgi:hypothetical protein